MLIPRRIQSVISGPDGRLPCDVVLDPNTEYILFLEEPVPAIKHLTSREHLVAWIEGCVLGDLRTLAKGIEVRESGDEPSKLRLGGGNYLLAGGCCMALEYFGQIYSPKGDATARARRYVESFLRPINQRYSDVYWLLWSCFRNGIIHASWPQGICLKGSAGDLVAVGANNSLEGKHLEPAPDSDYRGDSLVVSSPRFLRDLERSFEDGFRPWILNEADEQVIDRADPRLLEINPKNDEGVRSLDLVRRWNKEKRA